MSDSLQHQMLKILPPVAACSLEEFYDLLRERQSPDSLSFYDDRLAVHMGRWSGTSANSSANKVKNAAVRR